MRILTFLFFSFALFAQQNIIITDEKTGEPMLVGVCSVSDLQNTEAGKWFNDEYDFYEVNPEDLDGVPEKIKDVNVVIVLGTWCEDSHILVPRIIKVLDALNVGEDRIRMISVDRSKRGLNNEVDGLVIDLVPTIIFYRNETEIGRIIETVKESVEIDIAGIILADSD